MNKGLWLLETVADIMEMTNMIPRDRIIYVYAVTIKPIIAFDGDV